MLELVRPERTFVRLTIDRHIEVDFSLNRHFCTRALAVNVNISQKEFAHNTRVRYHHFCFSAFSTSSVYNFLYVHKILTSTLGTPKKPLERSFLHVCAIHDTYHHVSVNLLRITIHPFNSNMNTNSDNKLGKYKGSQFLPPCHHNQIWLTQIKQAFDAKRNSREIILKTAKSMQTDKWNSATSHARRSGQMCHNCQVNRHTFHTKVHWYFNLQECTLWSILRSWHNLSLFLSFVRLFGSWNPESPLRNIPSVRTTNSTNVSCQLFGSISKWNASKVIYLYSKPAVWLPSSLSMAATKCETFQFPPDENWLVWCQQASPVFAQNAPRSFRAFNVGL